MLREEAGRMRVAARRPDAVAGHAVGCGSLVMASGAADDVLPGLRPVEQRAAGSQPPGGMRVERVARIGGQPLLTVTVGAEADRVAFLTGGLARAGLDRV